MLKKHISDEFIIETSARLANEVGLENLSLKMIAKELGIKSPSLYNHFASLNDIKLEIMNYGWRNVGEKMIDSISGVTGYEALRNMCRTYYEYAIENKGVFTAMLWYNMYDNEENFDATKRLHEIIFQIMRPLNISEENIKHSVRLTRGFLEGFSLLVNNEAFGDSLSIDESFDLSMEILIHGVKSLEEK